VRTLAVLESQDQQDFCSKMENEADKSHKTRNCSKMKLIKRYKLEKTQESMRPKRKENEEDDNDDLIHFEGNYSHGKYG